MEGIIDFIYLIATALVLLVIWCIYRDFKLLIIKRKYQTAIKVINKFGYNCYSCYNYKGKGLIYRKQMDKSMIDCLLQSYNYEPLELSTQYKIFDYLTIIEYPEWEKQYYGEVVHDGRLLHFYMLEVQIRDKLNHRPIHYYLTNENGRTVACSQSIGEFIELNDPHIIESMISSDIKFILQKFNDNELRYWENELLKQTKNK